MSKLSKRMSDFINDTRWGYPSNYVGPNHEGSLVLISTSRDDDLLGESNWTVACEMFEGLDGVEIVRDSHWACGWIEYVLVQFEGIETDISKRLTLYKALKVYEALEDYPVLDDDHYSEHERESMYEGLERERGYFFSELLEFLGREEDSFTKKQVELLNDLVTYTYEADCYYRGFDQGYFVADMDNLENGLEFIKDNQLLENDEISFLSLLLIDVKSV